MQIPSARSVVDRVEKNSKEYGRFLDAFVKQMTDEKVCKSAWDGDKFTFVVWHQFPTAEHTKLEKALQEQGWDVLEINMGDDGHGRGENYTRVVLKPQPMPPRSR